MKGDESTTTQKCKMLEAIEVHVLN